MAGQSTGINGAGASYAYQDITAPQGIVYYRIAIWDANGSSSLSDVKTVDIKTGISITVYPNPADRELKISSTVSFNNSLLQLTNAAGQIVYSRRLNGTAPYSIDISALPAGTYYALIDDKRNKQKFSFVKK